MLVAGVGKRLPILASIGVPLLHQDSPAMHVHILTRLSDIDLRACLDTL